MPWRPESIGAPRHPRGLVALAHELEQERRHGLVQVALEPGREVRVRERAGRSVVGCVRRDQSDKNVCNIMVTRPWPSGAERQGRTRRAALTSIGQAQPPDLDGRVDVSVPG